MNHDGNRTALAHLRVLDLTWWIAGPQATTQLAMMGADVIRLESARRADGMRWTTPYAEGKPGIDRSGRWISHNYSKRSVALDLGTPEGRALAQRLVAVSDIVVENLSTGAAERMGMGYEALWAIKPDIILCSVSALGRNGPLRDYVGFGPSVAAFSGLASLTGRLGGPPGTVEPFLSDYVTAWHVALAVLAAVHERDRTGAGRHIEVSMAEAQMSQLPEAFIDATVNARPQHARGNEHPTMAPHGYYPCRGDDRWIAITAATDAQWRALCRVMGRRELAADPRFCDGPRRREHRQDLDAEIAAWTREHDSGGLQQRLQAAGVPAGAALRPEDVFADPHLRARGVFISPEHPEVGPYPMVGLAWKLSGTPQQVAAPPLLGQHSESVLCGLLGLDDKTVAELSAAQVLA